MEDGSRTTSERNKPLSKVRLIIVDDEIEKVRDIARLLAQRFSDDFDVAHVTNAQDARLRMRETRFDIALIDVNLPASVSSAPSAKAGFDLFDMLKVDPKVNLPDEVVFVTAREELEEEAVVEASQRGATVSFYRESANAWIDVLAGRVGYIIARKKRHQAPRVDVAIITALSSPELDAVLKLAFGWSNYSLGGDPTPYYMGTLKANGRDISVVAACAPRKGMPLSAALAAKMAHIFKPKLLVMVGICAGIRGKVALGDIIVADPTWDWGSGKQALSADELSVFRAAPYQSGLKQNIAALIQAAGRDPALCAGVRGGWAGKVPEGQLAVHLGPMASGASVLADDRSVGPIVEGHREVVAVEMEAYAVMAAADLCGTTPLVIKSVCDFADSEKSDNWQAYASYTSAAYLAHLLPKLAEAEIC